MRCRSDWPGLCFVVLNPRVLSANRVDFGLFLFHPPPPFTPILLIEISFVLLWAFLFPKFFPSFTPVGSQGRNCVVPCEHASAPD